jgi:hypothetical protein
MQRAWRRWSGFVIIALTAWLAVAPAGAADLALGWVGGAHLQSTTMDNDTTIDDAFGWRVRGAYHFNKTHAAELTYDSVSADSNIKTSTLSYDLEKIMVTYLATLKNKNPDAKWQAYALFGAGRVSYDNGFESESSSVIQGGGGVYVFFTKSKSLALRFDGRIWHFHGDSQIVPRDGFFSFDFGVGVSWLFGGK